MSDASREAFEKALKTSSAELPEFKSALDVVPPIDDPIGKYWNQPVREAIEISDAEARMSVNIMKALAEYNSTIPSGVYPGKMWKRKQAGEIFLCWYGIVEDKGCKINMRKIIEDNALASAPLPQSDAEIERWLDAFEKACLMRASTDRCPLSGIDTEYSAVDHMYRTTRESVMQLLKAKK